MIESAITNALKHAANLEGALLAQGIKSDAVAREVADEFATVIALSLTPTADQPTPTPTSVASHLEKAAQLPHEYIKSKFGKPAAQAYASALRDAAKAIRNGNVSIK